MTCEQAEQLLLELEAPAQGPPELLAHLEGCARCAAVAARVQQADQIVADRVERFVAKGDFAQEWAAARQRAQTSRRRPTFRYFLAVAALAAALLLVLRVALLPPPRLPSLQSLPEPDVLPPLSAPSAPARSVPLPDTGEGPMPPPSPRKPRPSPKPSDPPRAAKPAPAPAARPSPAPSPGPDPLPPVAIAPEPVTDPEPAEAPTVAPSEPAPPRLARPDPEPELRTVTVRLDPAVTAQRATLLCPSGRVRAARAGDQLRFVGVPEEACSLELGGTTLSTVDSTSGSYRVSLVDGQMVLQTD
jgi:outer membrane biosynthesis protein TonB